MPLSPIVILLTLSPLIKALPQKLSCSLTHSLTDSPFQPPMPASAWRPAIQKPLFPSLLPPSGPYLPLPKLHSAIHHYTYCLATSPPPLPLSLPMCSPDSTPAQVKSTHLPTPYLYLRSRPLLVQNTQLCYQVCLTLSSCRTQDSGPYLDSPLHCQGTLQHS